MAAFEAPPRKTGRLKGSSVCFLAILVLISLSFPAGGASSAEKGAGFSIRLTVRERSRVARRAEPVTSGVPVARSAGLLSTENLRLFDEGGGQVPAQFEVTSRWGGAPGELSLPIKWLLVDFMADVPAGGQATYDLRDSGGERAGTPLAVTRDDAGAIEIETGAARFTVSKARFNVFDSVVLGGRQLVTPAGSSAVVATDTGGRAYSSAASAPGEVELETDGPIRKTVRVSGGLTGSGGALLDYNARISVFAQSTEARLELTVTNRRDPVVSESQPQCWDIGCPESAAFSDLTANLDVNPGSGGSLLLGGAGGEFAGGQLEVYQDSSGTASWDRHRGNNPRPQSYVSFRGYRVYRDGGQVSAGDQASPWLDCSGDAGGVAVATRDFWQNFPKALRGSGTRLETSLFPSEYSGDFSFRPGEQKTHEILFRFHSAGADPREMDGRTKALADPLFAEASPEHYLMSGALGRVTGLTGDGEFAAYEQLNRSTLEGEGANLYKVVEDADFYSWQDYGDVPLDYEDGGTGTFNHKYNFDLGMQLQFMRTGDFRWFRLAEAAGKHVADLDVIHTPGAPDQWWEGGYFGHSYHDEDSNSNPNRNAGAPHPDLVFGTPGLLQLYYLTGYRPARETALEIAGNVKYRFDNSFGRGNGQGYAEAPDYENGCLSPRPFAHGLWVLIEAFKATGDAGYLDTAEWLISNSHGAVDLFIGEPIAGDRRYTKVFTWDLLEFSLGKYLDLCAEAGRTDGSGALDLLVAMTRQEARVMWKTDERGNKGVPYAWMKDGTPWGWEDVEVAVNVCNWHLLTADALAYGYAYGAGDDLMDRAREAFKTGSNPDIEYYSPVYTATKEATNSANFGLAYLYQVHPPDVPPGESAEFNEWLCLENPDAQTANVSIDYYFGSGASMSQSLEVPGRTRRTINVNDAVGGGRDVSARVTADRSIFAERPMYFDYHGSMKGGHCAAGTPAPATEWYFAEGCTRSGFETWITLENPGETGGLVTLTYMLENGENIVQQVNSPPESRVTVNVNDRVGPERDVSAYVSSQVPVIAERPMYFLYHGAWDGGHDEVGVAAPSTDWCFAEGTTRGNASDGWFEEWLCLQNPGASEAHVRVLYLEPGGGTIARDYAVAPASRRTVSVNAEVGPERDVGMKVSSDVPVIAERPMYFSCRGILNGGHDVAGAVEPGVEWHFAEGCTRDGFQTWLCLANTSESETTATVDYFLGTGRNMTHSMVLPPLSRTTIDVNTDIGPGEDVSMRVTSRDPIVCERPMYFSYGQGWAGGHAVMGATGAGTVWHFAEGCTR